MWRGRGSARGRSGGSRDSRRQRTCTQEWSTADMPNKFSACTTTSGCKQRSIMAAGGGSASCLSWRHDAANEAGGHGTADQPSNPTGKNTASRFSTRRLMLMLMHMVDTRTHFDSTVPSASCSRRFPKRHATCRERRDSLGDGSDGSDGRAAWRDGMQCERWRTVSHSVCLRLHIGAAALPSRQHSRAWPHDVCKASRVNPPCLLRSDHQQPRRHIDPPGLIQFPIQARRCRWRTPA